MIEMGIDHRLMSSVLKGKKIYEGRLRTSKFVTVRIGDRISFREDIWEDGRIVSSTPGKLSAVVTSTKFYDTFAGMLADIGVEVVLPDVATVDEALAIYRSYYTSDQEEEHGVIAIGFKLQ